MNSVSILLLSLLAVTLVASMPDQYPKISQDHIVPVDKADNNLGASVQHDIQDIITTAMNLAVAGVNLAEGIVDVCNPVTVFKGVDEILTASSAIAVNVLRLTTDIVDLGHQALPPNCSATTANDATESPTCTLYQDIHGIYVNALDLLTLGGGLTKAIKDLLHGHIKKAIQDVIDIGNTMVQDIENISSYCLDIVHKFLPPPGSNEDAQMNLANARGQLQQQIEKLKQVGKQPLQPEFAEQGINQGLDQMEKQFDEAKRELLKIKMAQKK